MPDQVIDIPDGALLLTRFQVAEICQVNPMTIHRWSQSASMPAPVRKGKRVVRWRRDEIEYWISLGLPGQALFEQHWLVSGRKPRPEFGSLRKTG